MIGPVHLPTDQAREEARRNPGGWAYTIEGNYGTCGLYNLYGLP